jgi:uncharacterized protein YjbI with pentapeptide repeats
MTFLGKIYLESGGKRLGVKADGNLAMLSLGPNDPAGIFLAYDTGGGWFSLQAYTGSWVSLYAEQSPIAWYPVLTSARVGSPTRFSLQFFDRANRRVKLAFTVVDDGREVAFLITSGINPYCRCEFDVGNGWLFGLYFGMGVIAPGVPELQQTRNGVGYDFTCVGKACVDLNSVTFESINFQDANFSGANLRQAKFKSCTLIRTKFQNTDLTSSDFSGSSVAGTDFSGADLTKGTLLPEPPLASSPAQRTLFRNARLPVTLLKKNWSYLDLTGAQLTGLDTADLEGLIARCMLAPGLDLSGRKLTSADFSNSDLTLGKFQDATLTSAKMQSAILAECIFSRAQMQRVNFDPFSSGIQAVSTDLSGAKFSAAQLPGASMKQAILWRAVFTAANMEDINLTSAQLGGADRSAAASLSYAYMANAKLDKANLFGVSFAFATLFGASASITETATMEQSDFSNAYLAGIDLAGANLRGAKFSGACLVNVRLISVVLLPSASGSVTASLAGATLQGADFTGAQLNHADLSNAAVSFANAEIPVRYCDDLHEPFPPPPGSMPLRYGPTVSLNLTTMGLETKCPNGFTVTENEANGKTLQEMLTSANAPTTWFPAKCGPALGELNE